MWKVLAIFGLTLLMAFATSTRAALSQPATAYRFVDETGSTISAIQLQDFAVVVVGSAHTVRAYDPTGAPQDLYSVEDTAMAPAPCGSPCMVSVPRSSAVLQKVVLKRQHAGGAPTDGPPFFVLTVPTNSVVVSANQAILDLPDPLPRVFLTVLEQGGTPTISISSGAKPGGSSPLFNVDTGSLAFPNGIPGIASFAGHININGTATTLALTMSADGMTADASVSQQPHANGTLASPTISRIHIIESPASVDIRGDASFSDPLFGTISSSDVQLALNNTNLEVTGGTFTWHPTNSQIPIGPQTSITVSDVTARIVNGVPTITATKPFLSSVCGNSPLPDLTFFNGTLEGDDGSFGTALTIKNNVSLSLADACVTASNVALKRSSRETEAHLTATLVAPWLPQGAIITAPNVTLKWDASNVLSLTSDISFSAVKTFTLGGVQIDDLSARLTTTGAFHVTGFLNGTAVDAVATNTGFTADIRNASLQVSGMTLSNTAGRLIVGKTTSIEIDDAQLAIPFGPKGSPLTLALAPLEPSKPALIYAWNGSKWAKQRTAAAVDVNGDAAIVNLSPMQFRLAKYDGSSALRPEFTGCSEHAAALDGQSGAVVLCGQLLQASNDPTSLSAIKNFCADVGAIYTPERRIEFSTLELTQASTPEALHPKCVEGFDFENLFRARLQDFVLEWGDDAKQPTSCKSTGLCLIAQVLVTPISSVPGIDSALFQSALFGIQYTADELTMSGQVTSLHEFSIPNIANFKVTSLGVMATYKKNETHIALRAGDSITTMPGALGFTVYGQGGGLQYDRAANDRFGRWSPKFPNVQLTRTLVSAVASLVTNAGSYSVLSKGIHFWPFRR